MAVIVAAALVAIGRKADWRLPLLDTRSQVAALDGSEAKPQDVIYRMLDGAAQGDVPGYLGCYSGVLLRRLQQSRDEMTPDGFARYLVQTNQQIKGVAISEPETRSETEIDVRVEFVYQDRNEAQTFSLERSSGEWKIARVSSAERVETLVPYGTPVY
jgi:hypothetical protein